MTFLEIALSCIARGWHVFPCVPHNKNPLIPGGHNAASNNEEQIRAWWARWPEANVAIAVRPSRLAVLDCDHGLANEEDFRAWVQVKKLPNTYTVRTGRRVNPKDGVTPEYGVQCYYSVTEPDIKTMPWADGEQSGDIRCSFGYVMAAGCIHPESGEKYEVLVDAPIVPVPDYVRTVPTAPITGKPGGTNQSFVDDGGPISEWRNVRMISILGKFRSQGHDDDELEAYAHEINESRMVPPFSERELGRLIENAYKFPIPGVTPEVLIGGRVAGTPELKEPVDWRTRYMTENAYLNVKPPEFLINGFLAKRSIAMLAGPVAQRKSIIALNIAHSLCTGEPLFGYFDVPGGHERVIYLCPEMGAASFVKRIKQIGLGKYVGKTLFIQTMSEAPTALDELDSELPGAVVIVDTITRFIEGDENKSEDMRKFAQKVFRLMNAGATVVLLHHSKKGSSGSLDDGLRGSSELAAFVDSCWVTELEDPKKPYESLSKMRNVKQRDFESNPFKLRPAIGSYYLSMDGEPEPEAVLKGKADDAAKDALSGILAVTPQIGVNKLRAALKAAGHGRGQRWVMAARATLLKSGVTHSQ